MRMFVCAAMLAIGFSGAVFAQQSSYNIYFVYDAAKLTPDAKDLAGEIAKQCGAKNVTVVGHADTAEAKVAAHAQSLSEERASAVVAELKKGGASGSMSVSGVGASQLAMPTSANVREPLNRFAKVFC